jgi:hypothetical protein
MSEKYPRRPGFVAGSKTSKDASDSIDSDTLRAKVFSFIYGRGGATCDEVEVGLGMRHQTASARIRELVLKGSLIDSGIVRQTRSGRDATVWQRKERKAA